MDRFMDDFSKILANGKYFHEFLGGIWGEEIMILSE